MKNLIIIGHPNKESFCYNGIFKTLKSELEKYGEEVQIIDLYGEEFSVFNSERNRNLVQSYQEKIKWTDRIYFISPVWWFRCTPLLEAFFDEVFVPKFAYNFVSLTKTYGYPQPLLKDKKVRTYLTHGSPALPVLSIYLNVVRLRLSVGVYSFIFGWFRTKIKQFWSVPFVSSEVRDKYLECVKKDVKKDVEK